MDDRWRGSYDAWKLQTPPEYEITPEEENKLWEEARESLASDLIADLSEALEEMLFNFNHPHRDEWLSEAAFERAKNACAAAARILADVKSRW
jgi:hypothetical protein